MERIENIDEYKQKLLMSLTEHIGKSRIVGMRELYEKVFGKSYNRLINDTRMLRKLVEILRREGVPVCSSTKKGAGGYYLASAGSELEQYCRNLHNRALRVLVMEAKLRKIALPELLGEMQLNFNR